MRGKMVSSRQVTSNFIADEVVLVLIYMWLYVHVSSFFELIYLLLICNFYEVVSEVNLVTLFRTFPLS